MSAKEEPSGRRSVEVEFEVPGTPDEVWRAIATGPGISSWFVPTEIEEQDGRPVAMKSTFGPGMEPRSALTEWDPPHKFTAQGESWAGAPPMASEWSVEALAGGKCRIRIVYSLFADTDEWDNQLEGAKLAFSGFLRTLTVYLTHFPGQRSVLSQFVAPVAGSEAEAWEALTAALGLQGVSVAQPWTAPAGAPPLGGMLESITEAPYDALLRLDQPGPGIVALGVFGFPGGGSTMLAMNVYLYGDQAAETAAREAPRWQTWIEERFPAPAETGLAE